MPSPFSERCAIFPQEKRKPSIGCIGLAPSGQKERSPRTWKKVRDAEVETAIHVLQAKSRSRYRNRVR
jgi:hypothetical protein